MTVTTTLDRQNFDGDGSNKNFPFNFKFFNNSQIFVFLISVDGTAVGQTQNVDYTISGANSAGGGQIVFTVAPPVGVDNVLVSRVIPLTQPTSIRNQGAFFPAIHEDAFDRLTMIIQQAVGSATRSLQKDLSGLYWDFMNYQAINLEDPTRPQDAANMRWVQKYIGALIGTGQGPVNSAANVLYTSPAGPVVTVQDMSSADPNLGSALIYGAGRVVNTVADVIALPALSQGVFALGYYEPGDGGGGSYAPKPGDATTVNNGTVLPASGGIGRWFLCQSISPSLLQFGIRAGDTSDQTAAMQAAVDAMAGKELRATSALYRLDGSLEVKAGARLAMEKGALFKRISAKTAATVPMLYVLDSYSECRGGKVLTENASPSGCVVLGHKSSTDNRNAWYWRFCDMDVEGNGSGWGWVIVSGQVTYPMNANYFGTVQNVNTKAFDFGCLLFENANAHNISNVHFWLSRIANIWCRGAYANNFSNMFFHGGAADGCISIQLVNKVLGTYTESEQNKFIGFTCETGGPNDKAFDIDTLCTGNVLIGTSNVAGGYTVRNADNNIQLNGYGSASYVSLPGEATKKTGVVPSVATLVTPPGQMSTGESGAYDITVQVYNSANPSLTRTDKLLVSSRNSSFGPSPVVNIGSAFTALGVSGEPTSVVYALDFSGGVSAPALSVTVTSVGGAGLFTVKTRMQRV